MATLSLIGMLRRSLIHRRARSVSALVAMTVSAGVATALLTLYAILMRSCIRSSQLWRERCDYGSCECEDAGGCFGSCAACSGADAVATEFGYAVATTDTGTPVVVAGTDFAAVKRLDSWWQVDAWPDPSAKDAALVGQRAAQFVGMNMLLR